MSRLKLIPFLSKPLSNKVLNAHPLNMRIQLQSFYSSVRPPSTQPKSSFLSNPPSFSFSNLLPLKQNTSNSSGSSGSSSSSSSFRFSGFSSVLFVTAASAGLSSIYFYSTRKDKLENDSNKETDDSSISSYLKNYFNDEIEQLRKTNSNGTLYSPIDISGFKIYPSLLAILAVHGIIFLCWRHPSYRVQAFMNRNFTTSYTDLFSVRTFHTIGTSFFAHEKTWHLLFNSIALWSFATPVIQTIGEENFVKFYLACGVGSGLLGYLFTGLLSSGYLRSNSLQRRQLGASGAVYGIFAIFSLLFPDSKCSIIFLPFITFPASYLFAGMVCLDTAGLIYSARIAPSVLGHGAHLGGALLGYLATEYYFNNLLSVRRLKWWQERQNGRK